MGLMALGKGFISALKDLENSFQIWRIGGVIALERNLRVIGQKVKTQARRRVPVDEGQLRDGIVFTVFREGPKLLTLDVGTSVVNKTGFPYPVVIEFGSRHIAGGAVKALGRGSDITDVQAISDWPAKRKRGGKASEQMPWLRPAWSAVQPEALVLINSSFEPPAQGKTRGRITSGR